MFSPATINMVKRHDLWRCGSLTASLPAITSYFTEGTDTWYNRKSGEIFAVYEEEPVILLEQELLKVKPVYNSRRMTVMVSPAMPVSLYYARDQYLKA